MITPTEENYLKAVFNLIHQKGEAGVYDVSKELDITMPTVNSMVKRLADKGFVIYESYKPLRLTETGLKTAALIIRKHRLTEMYLVEKMGFGWDEVHQIAEQVEHVQSFAFFEKMDELLGFPKVDPHGSPIPDAGGNVVYKDYTRLTECRVGDKVKLMEVSPSTDDILKYLSGIKLLLGTVLTIHGIESFDGTMQVTYNDVKYQPLGPSVCDRLLVLNANG